jgi:hypothetical protein
LLGLGRNNRRGGKKERSKFHLVCYLLLAVVLVVMSSGCSR